MNALARPVSFVEWPHGEEELVLGRREPGRSDGNERQFLVQRVCSWAFVEMPFSKPQISSRVANDILTFPFCAAESRRASA